MNIEQAVQIVKATNPKAVFYASSFFQGEPDYFEIYDFTYSDEVRACIGTFDCVFDELCHPDGSTWK